MFTVYNITDIKKKYYNSSFATKFKLTVNNIRVYKRFKAKTISYYFINFKFRPEY